MRPILFDKLPYDLNLHLFSFLSSDEAKRISVVDKGSNKFVKDINIWSNFTKRDFASKNIADIKKPQLEYKTKIKQLEAEIKSTVEFIEPFVYTLKEEKLYQDPIRTTRLLTDFEIELRIKPDDYFTTYLYHTKYDDRIDHESIAQLKRDLAKNVIHTIHFPAEKNIELNSCSVENRICYKIIFKVLAKKDVHSFFHQQIVYKKLDANILQDCLHTAAVFLNFNTIKVLLDSKLCDPNKIMQLKTDKYEMNTTPFHNVVLELISNIGKMSEDDYKLYKKILIEFVKSGADPEIAFLYKDEEGRKATSNPKQYFIETLEEFPENIYLADFFKPFLGERVCTVIPALHCHSREGGNLF